MDVTTKNTVPVLLPKMSNIQHLWVIDMERCFLCIVDTRRHGRKERMLG